MSTRAPTAAVRAADLMIPIEEYPHIPYWFTLREALAEIEQSQLEHAGRKSLPRAVLVFDERYQLLGIVRRRDILRGLEPDFLAGGFRNQKQPFAVTADASLTELSWEELVSGLRAQCERPVSEVMLPLKTTVQADDNLLKVVYEMTRNNLSFVPVLRDGKVAGVVRTVELCREVARLVL